jgi:hypothetical protein
MSDLGRVEVAGGRDLAVVTDIDPGVAPQARHLELEQLRIQIYVAVDAIRADQTTDGSRISAVAIHFPPSCAIILP